MDQATASSYAPGGAAERTRLTQQSLVHRALDMRMLACALSGVDGRALGLDVGCAAGHVTFDRFGAFDAFTEVIGVDKDAGCLAAANAARPDPSRWTFARIDVESASAEDELTALLSTRDPDLPVVVLLALVLLHVGAPIAVLSMLRRVLPAGSLVVVRSSDDGTKLAYPDRADRIRRIVEMTRREPGKSDRISGRKLHHQLHRAGFADVRLFAEPLLLPSLEREERRALFATSFGHRLAGWEAEARAGRLSEAELLEVAELRAALEQAEADFDDPEFFYFETIFGAVATSLADERSN